jgi:hypothetical protein
MSPISLGVEVIDPYKGSQPGKTGSTGLGLRPFIEPSGQAIQIDGRSGR